jgi:NADH-quinone oxidoreductase subunit N
MNTVDLAALLPLILLGATPVVALLAIAVRRSHDFTLGVTLVGLAASFAALFPAARVAPRQVTPLLSADGYTLLYTGLLVAATFAVAILAHGYLERHAARREEFYVLLTLAASGAATLASASHFASFFLGLEILSVSLYALVGYAADRPLSLEAAIKYLVLAASSAAVLLFGIALVYSALGTMYFPAIAAQVAGSPSRGGALLGAGVVLLITGIGFKLALVPFHMWAPDVYEGAPAPVAAFVATVSKGAVFAVLFRYFQRTGSGALPPVALAFASVAVLSMVLGNLLALLQDNVKRILAYSSIAHMGYLLVAFLSSGRLAAVAATFYLVAYFVTTLVCFAVLTLLSGAERDADAIADYRGLFWRRPAVAVAFTGGLLSLAGIPLTAGFIGKFYVMAAGASAERWGLVLVLVVSSVIGLFYYLRVVAVLYARVPGAADAPTPSASPLAADGRALLAVLALLVVWLGVYPASILRLIRSAMGDVF